jgi:hypothetical protein
MGERVGVWWTPVIRCPAQDLAAAIHASAASAWFGSKTNSPSGEARGERGVDG